jgi:hypothetical protein
VSTSPRRYSRIHATVPLPLDLRTFMQISGSTSCAPEILKDATMTSERRCLHCAGITVAATICACLASCGERRGTLVDTVSYVGHAKRLEAIEEVRIHGVAADLVPVPFGWQRGIAIARDGSITVAQPQDNTIRFFSVAGTERGRFGRAGDGPGEFRRLGGLGWLGDTLWGHTTTTFSASPF